MTSVQIVDRKPEEYGKVAVLLGGYSAEREVSLSSGEAIYNALVSRGIDTVKIDLKGNLYQSLMSNDVDRVFIALHGRDGEDGVVQGFLQTIGMPYTGSNVESSAVAMNKQLSKQLWQKMGILTANFVCIAQGEKVALEQAKNILATLGGVAFVKPVREGSSVGMTKVHDANDLILALDLAHQYDDALIETYIKGKEYTVSILDDRALPSIRLQTPRDFYDYEAKYKSKTTQYFCPSGLSDEDETMLRGLAERAFKTLGCHGWGRIDFLRDESSEKFYILEANTVPGMTNTSLVPKAAAADGMSFEQLVLRILETSFEREKQNVKG
ncbi:MAG: D-alanine--D-alanine ligase [Gammaproteobacteria bacterium]|nr:D-alanine--D-alanine ligase [Gammaproteobacteria bacterium]